MFSGPANTEEKTEEHKTETAREKSGIEGCEGRAACTECGLGSMRRPMSLDTVHHRQHAKAEQLVWSTASAVYGLSSMLETLLDSARSLGGCKGQAVRMEYSFGFMYSDMILV